LVERKKSLQAIKRNNERLLKNAKGLGDDLAMCEISVKVLQIQQMWTKQERWLLNWL
jgi:hypothetical protein